MLKQEGHNAGQNEVKKGGFSILNILVPFVVIGVIGGGIFYVAQSTTGRSNEDYAAKVQKMLEAKKAAEQDKTAPVEKVMEEAKNIEKS